MTLLVVKPGRSNRWICTVLLIVLSAVVPCTTSHPTSDPHDNSNSRAHPGFSPNQHGTELPKNNELSLLQAAKEGNVVLVKLFLQFNAINEMDSLGHTALHYAAMEGHVNVVAVLLEHAARQDAMKEAEHERQPVSGHFGQLRAATMRAFEGCKRMMGKHGFDVNARNIYGLAALHCASQRGHEHVVCSLLGHAGIDVNIQDDGGDTALHKAASEGHDSVVKALLKHDNLDSNAVTKFGQTALIAAVQRGHIGVVEALLAHCPLDINAENPYGGSALYEAALRGQVDIVKRLLQHDWVDVNDFSREGRTALAVAAERGHVDVVKALLGADDVDINAVKHNAGFTALCAAAGVGHLDVVTLLLEHPDTDVNARSYGCTALHLAAMNGHVGIVEALSRHPEVDVNIKDLDGCTPLYHACSCNKMRSEIWKSSVSKDKTKRAKGVDAVFHHLKPESNIDTVETLLVADGIDIHAKNNEGSTALAVAAKHGHIDIVRALVKLYDD